MKNLLYIFVLSSMMLISCNTVKMDTPLEAKKLVEFNRGACFGTCPTFSVLIKTDGSVIYKGKMHVDRIGEYSKQLTKKEYKDLYSLLSKAELGKLDNVYDHDVRDAAVVKVSYFGETGKKNISTKISFPGELKNVIHALDMVSKDEKGMWTSIDVSDLKEEEIVNNEPPKVDQPTRQILSYSQGACFGKCPVFSLDLLSDRTVIYVGKRFTKKEGIFEKQISQKQFDQMVSLLEHKEFMSLEKVYDENVMDAQQVTLKFFDKNRKAKSVKTKITRSEHLQKIIDLVLDIEDSKGWKKKDGKNAAPASSETIMVSIKPNIKAKKWIASQKHLGLKLVKFLSPNGTYFIVSYDLKLDRNRVMEELRRSRDVLAITPGDQLAKPRGGTTRSGTINKHGKGRLGGE